MPRESVITENAASVVEAAELAMASARVDVAWERLERAVSGLGGHAQEPDP